MKTGLSQCFCLGENYPPSSHPDARQFSSSPYVHDAFQAALELRENESKSMCGPFKRNSLELQLPSVSCSHNPCWFLKPEVMGTSLPGTETLGWGAWCGAGNSCSSGKTSAAEISLLKKKIFICLFLEREEGREKERERNIDQLPL